MSEKLYQEPDRISQFFHNKTVLITGATGFVGKTLLEKLLRCCQNVRQVYVLVRSKNGQDADLRMKDIFKNPIFSALKQENEQVFSKVQVIGADLAHFDLNLSDSDRKKIQENVEIIYHCAAILLDVPLQQAVAVNVRGTKLMLNLAQECQKLTVFVHVSSAFCHTEEKILYEKLYPAPRNPHEMIQVCESLESHLIEKIKPEYTKKSLFKSKYSLRLLDQFPNCYPFTKALAEGLVSEKINQVPVIIIRASCVLPIWKMPLPGYTDSLNGPIGLLVASGKGILRTMYFKENAKFHGIPADILANALIFAAYDFVTSKEERRVYNAVASQKIRVSELVNESRFLLNFMPFGNILWYPNISLTQSKITHYFNFFLFQLLPGILLDALYILLRFKPFLYDVQVRIWGTLKLYEFYCNRDWQLDNTASLKAVEKLNCREKEIYGMDGNGGVLRYYLTDCVKSAKWYILKESDDQIPKARKQMQMMWVVDFIVKMCVVSFLFYYLCQFVL